MKKAINAILGMVALIAGTLTLGEPTTNVVTFDWFGRFCLAVLVCLTALWLIGAFKEDDTSETDNHEILKEG